MVVFSSMLVCLFSSATFDLGLQCLLKHVRPNFSAEIRYLEDTILLHETDVAVLGWIASSTINWFVYIFFQ